MGHRRGVLRVAARPDPGVPRVPDLGAVPGAVRYPALTDEIKRKILGLDALRLHDIDPVTVPCTFTRDDLQRLRETIPVAVERRSTNDGGSDYPELSPGGLDMTRLGSWVPSTAEEKLDRLESLAEIRQLPSRYALAVDPRDVDGLVSLFVPDVRVGRERARGATRCDSVVRPVAEQVPLVGALRRQPCGRLRRCRPRPWHRVLPRRARLPRPRRMASRCHPVLGHLCARRR